MTDAIKEKNLDSLVDDEILDGLNLDRPKSFFLFAGAGSGKTRTLVNVLEGLRTKIGERLRIHAKHIAVITYTNAACEVIKARLGSDSIFSVSTIHSFTWELIRPFQSDIREWLRRKLIDDIAELEAQQSKSRSPTNKTSIERASKIRSKRRRLESLDTIRCFSYNPNSDNRGRDSLNHAEVIALGAHLIVSTQLGKMILSQKFPILLIDESQDTNKDLMEAFLSVQAALPNSFCLGLLGDTMQRIYSDGKVDLGQNIPSTWLTPKKVMNHRCPKRIIELINRIRLNVDGMEQVPRTDSDEGLVRLFLVNQSAANKSEIENEIALQMSDITGDQLWSGQDKNVKTLTLEHHMAANRMGFLPLFMPLYEVDQYKTSLLDGTQPGLQVLINCVSPLIRAHNENDDFTIAKIVRERSPLLDSKTLNASLDQISLLKAIHEKTKNLLSLWDLEQDPKLSSILTEILNTGLFELHESVLPALSVINGAKATIDDSDPQSEEDAAWEKVLDCPFSMLESYNKYISNDASFGTHQGVKGMEFNRVMVILDDEEARGFLFSYEKLFGVKDRTKSDIENEALGKDTGYNRALRLFYVTCSRAEKSLAVVAYTESPNIVRDFVINNGWFNSDEIILV